MDNDLFGTDHTPGYPSAARFTALSVLYAGILARDMKRVDQFVIYQSIGRDAGWLTAAAALAKTADPESAPHILLLPEVAFKPDAFLEKVEKTYKRFGWVSIACGEGVKYADGTPVSASDTRDKFGNIELGAMGGTSVGLNVHKIISKEFGWRGEFQITESLPMSAADRAVKLDSDEAYKLGVAAVKLAASGVSGKMVIARPRQRQALLVLHRHAEPLRRRRPREADAEEHAHQGRLLRHEGLLRLRRTARRRDAQDRPPRDEEGEGVV